MNNIFSVRRLRLLSLIAVAILLVLLVMIVLRWATTTKPPGSVGSTWNNITVGVSTTEQVIVELGPPDRVTQHIGRAEYYYYDDVEAQEYALDRYRIELYNGVVTSIWDNIAYDSKGEKRYLSEYINAYGTPDYITWANYIYSYANRAVVFLDDGILLLVSVKPSPSDTLVRIAHYFRPCSLQDVLFRHSIFLSTSHGPPDQAGSIPMEVWQARDPWGFTPDQ